MNSFFLKFATRSLSILAAEKRSVYIFILIDEIRFHKLSIITKMLIILIVIIIITIVIIVMMINISDTIPTQNTST